MTTADAPALRLGGRRVPILLPSWRDARLHTAAVILSVHVIGITTLGFRVSVPQILSAILAAAVVDVVFTLGLTGKLVWPASGMLTGSGVALILRLVEMEAGQYWTWTGWHIYALVAGLSVITKYVIRVKGSHLFNPSNVGLVAAFLILGSGAVEPLDFWWAPLDGWMLLAYLIILVGGIVITHRLALLETALIFWVALGAGLGMLAASGHCMAAAWSPEPVCGSDFWWTLVTSPEILVFQLFMITDPKTIPTGRWARMLFAATLGVLATFLIAPQPVEFGAKVALLGSLVILSPMRGLFDRLIPTTAPGFANSRRAFMGGTAIGAGLVTVAVGIVLAGSPARQPASAVYVATAPEVDVDPATLPAMTVESAVAGLDLEVEPEDLAVTLAENLLIEGQAVREGNGSLLAGAATGERLAEMQQRVSDAVSTGEAIVNGYTFDSLTLDVADTGDGQSSAALSIEATGTEETITYDPDGIEVSRTTSGFAATFVLRLVGGDRWLIASAGPEKER